MLLGSANTGVTAWLSVGDPRSSSLDWLCSMVLSWAVGVASTSFCFLDGLVLDFIRFLGGIGQVVLMNRSTFSVCGARVSLK